MVAYVICSFAYKGKCKTGVCVCALMFLRVHMSTFPNEHTFTLLTRHSHGKEISTLIFSYDKIERPTLRLHFGRF